MEQHSKIDEPFPPRITSESTLVDTFALESPKLAKDPSKYEYILKRVQDFNASLEKSSDADVYLLKSVPELWQLLDLYYSSENPAPLSLELFPYLHGLASIKQRAYYHDQFDVERDLNVLALSNDEIAEKYPHFKELQLPHSAFHLMTVNTLQSPNPSIINSVHMDDLLTLSPTTECISVSQDLDHTLYEPFDSVYRLRNSAYDELKNRNYNLQIKLMAPLCHFLLYNDEEDSSINVEAASLISSLMGPNKKPIYIVDFPFENLSAIEPYLNKNLKFAFCDPSNETECATARERIPLLEQTLMWLRNGFHTVFNGLYVGNALNYHQIQAHPGVVPVEFSVYICCHDRASMPTKDALNAAIRVLNDKQHSIPVSLEFPDFIGRYGSSIPEEDLLNYLNLLRFIKLVIKSKKNVFAYSYDGFAGSSLLLASYGLFAKFSQLEEGLLKMFLKLKPKICLTKEDYYFLKTADPFIKWFRKFSTRNCELLFDIPLEKVGDTDYEQDASMDWFHNEINLPSNIYGGIFLGSVEQASSLTVLSALNIKKVVSIDEKPEWFSALNVTFQHDATLATLGPVVKPIFAFNDGKSLVYEVVIESDAVRSKIITKGGNFPQLTSIVYIYNIRDDGKDSFLQLLEQCPDEIQKKVLVDPRQEERVLFHCRVGVSRSATLIIASLMKYFSISFLESYLYVRVLRYNMIIQPNLRLFYELFLYGEHLRSSQIGASQRKLCWWTVCEQVYGLNKPYVR